MPALHAGVYNGERRGGRIPELQANVGATGAWVLDRFQLRRVLSVGETGELWLARERDSRELVAARLGIGAPGPARDEALGAERAKREGRVLERVAALTGPTPGVPRLVAQGPIEPGGWCVVSEYVEGAPLAKLLRVTSPAPPRAIAWSKQIAEALVRLHAAGVVHGDLHPGNVIVARDEAGRDRMVLVGFGVAAFDGERGTSGPASAHTAAPEVVRGQPPTPRTDVYAVGVILYRMLVERWPFAGTEQDVLRAQVGTPPPPLGRHTPSLRLPPGLEALVFRCLEKDPADRFPTAEALAEALAELAFLPHRDWVRVDGREPNREPSMAPAPTREDGPDGSVAPGPTPPTPAPQVWVLAAGVVGLVAFGSIAALWWW